MNVEQPLQMTYLGKSTPAPESPDEAVLDRIPNAHPDTPYLVRFSAPEFTTLCAVAGQPDFAHFVIDYVPRAWLIESKALKFYLSSFRNHVNFHEQCTVSIGKRLALSYEPEYLRICGFWYARGGMPIDVFWQFGTLPSQAWLPDPGIPTYKARG